MLWKSFQDVFQELRLQIPETILVNLRTLDGRNIFLLYHENGMIGITWIHNEMEDKKDHNHLLYIWYKSDPEFLEKEHKWYNICSIPNCS